MRLRRGLLVVAVILMLFTGSAQFMDDELRDGPRLPPMGGDPDLISKDLLTWIHLDEDEDIRLGIGAQVVRRSARPILRGIFALGLFGDRQMKKPYIILRRDSVEWVRIEAQKGYLRPERQELVFQGEVTGRRLGDSEHMVRGSYVTFFRRERRIVWRAPVTVTKEGEPPQVHENDLVTGWDLAIMEN